MKTKRLPTRAYSLIEVMVAMAIGMVIMAAVLGSYITSWKGFTELGQMQLAHSDARYANQIFSREIRQVNAVSSFSATDITVSIPLTFSSNGTVDTTKIVRFYLDGCELVWDDGGTLNKLIESNNCSRRSVSSLTFTLYDAAGAETVVLANAKSIKMDLTLDYSNQNPPRTDTSSSKIKLRLN